MTFLATQRCPLCKRADTIPVLACDRCKIKSPPPSFPLANGYDKEHGFTCPQCKGNDKLSVKILCNLCSHVFKPNDVKNVLPILPCIPCKTNTLHRFVEDRPRTGLDHVAVAFESMYACVPCGTERKFGNSEPGKIGARP